MMFLMDWTAVATIIATGAVTLGGVALKGRYDARVERLRIEAQREEARQQRELEDKREREALARKTADDRRAIGDDVLTVFSTILENVSYLSDTTRPAEMERVWISNHDAKARRAIESVPDADTRDYMLLILDALSDFNSYAEVNDITRFGGWNAKALVRILVELAGCVSRGDQASERLKSSIEQTRQRLAAVEAMYEPF